MTLDALLKQAAQRLQAAGSSSPRIDAEVLLCHVLGRDRTWLYTWGDKICPLWEQARFDALIAARVQGTPVAYLTGEREFWGLRLATSPDTLIPRPDTETLVELALSRAALTSGRLLDLGTGTGAIALAFASEQPHWQVLGVDLRVEAVSLATRNAQALGLANATFLQSDWFAALDAYTVAGNQFDIIVSNPPYIAGDDPHLAEGDVRFEPRSALVADACGMADLLHLVNSAQRYLAASGWLLLEHGYQQAEMVREALGSAGYQNVESVRDLGGHERVTLGHL
ncbi:peptide chain release factor N(5)-glutamine methyltransferase [Halomonas sp. FeN2]|uniref:peptide chain release factor N(5)-glutamine methyltransferase n=1 Tax=Halomonas sp. FeN2 TaxID=2832500 RepID=UPI000C54F296|nr:MULTISPECIES: peptide chain release factor N(5)-glutamine methyltransferase [unclassified Halomonas]MBF56653.1 protein-(glutamine-N5) methyltransferase, release factor-specific [Halomonas sp.]UBR50736.1 peptide chain release factor N(5)-glutamine methyltransferase [Halomonas sp. FeN2]|tara:strand:- start:1249 stop:2097 length:849 start_codon:yes stop_codon:yes gene_type:complete